jgi:hypothetical protein
VKKRVTKRKEEIGKKKMKRGNNRGEETRTSKWTKDLPLLDSGRCGVSQKTVKLCLSSSLRRKKKNRVRIKREIPKIPFKHCNF